MTDIAPVITSATSVSIPEGTLTTATIYTAAASDVAGTILSYSLTGADANDFTIDSATGVVKFNAVPNATLKAVYNFNVIANDGLLSSSIVPVTLKCD